MNELIGKEVVLFCANYIYAGKLRAWTHEHAALEDAHIVYETGPFTDAKWKDAQRLPTAVHYIERGAIESWGPVDRKAGGAT